MAQAASSAVKTIDVAAEFKALTAEVKKLPEISWKEGKYASEQTVSSGLAVKGAAAGRRQNVVRQGMVSGAAVLSGALQNVEAGGFAAAMKIKSGGVQRIGSDGLASAAAAASGGLQLVGSGGIAVRTRIGNGGIQLVGGGMAASAFVSAGGLQQISAGGAAIGARIASGGTQHVAGDRDSRDCGTAFGAVVSAGGLQIVEGSAVDAEVYGTQMGFGGFISGGAVHKGGKQVVYLGTVQNMLIDKGGVQILRSAACDGAQICGSQTAEDAELRDIAVKSGGRQTIIGKTCEAWNLNIERGAAQTAGASSMRISGLRLEGTQTVKAGYVTGSGFAVNETGVQIVSCKALTASGSTVVKGKQTLIANDGSIESSIVETGGVQTVKGGRLSIYNVQINGGTQTICCSDGGVFNVRVSNGGRQTILSAVRVSGAVIEAGGLQKVAASGVWMQNLRILQGGSMIIQSPHSVVMDNLEVEGFFKLQPVSAGYGKIDGIKVRGHGTAAVMGTAVVGSAAVEDGGLLKAYSGAILCNFSVGRNGRIALQAGASFGEGAISGGIATGTAAMASRASLVVAGSADMSRLSIRLSSGASLTFGGAGTVLGALTAAKKTEIGFSVADAKPNSDFLLSIDAAKAKTAGAGVSVSIGARQQAGTYRIEKGLAQAAGAQWILRIGEKDAAKAALNGSAASFHGKSYRLASSGGAVSMAVSLEAGKMLRGAAKGGTLAGTDKCDVFCGGAGNDSIKCRDGSDVAVYGKGKWGSDVIDAAGACLTMLFKDVPDVQSRLSGDTMTFVRKSDESQKIAVKGWNDAANAVVFAKGTDMLNKWCAGTALTDAQLKTARTEAWKAAKLA